MPRPSKLDQIVRTAAFEVWWAKYLAPTLRELGAEDLAESRTSAEVIMIEDSPGEDGYEIAKDFESATWMVDEEFVDICANWRHCLYEAHRKAVIEWQKKENPKPKLAKGDKVKIRYDFKLVDGVITNLFDEKAQYLVFCESLGHVGEISDEELFKRGSATHGILIDYEVVEADNPPKQEIS